MIVAVIKRSCVYALLLFAVFAFGLNPIYAATTSEVKQKIVTHCAAMGVEPEMMLSIANVESGFRQAARGASGTVGVFQLMPSTARRMGYNPYNLDENIKAGITYYKNAYNMLGSREFAIAAYNSGPDAVKRCKCVPAHSRAFVNKIMKNYNYYKSQKTL